MNRRNYLGKTSGWTARVGSDRARCRRHGNVVGYGGDDRGDETKDDSAYLVLKQTGAAITGTIGPNAERRFEITKGTADGNSVYIEAIVEGDNKLVLRLKVEGDKLVGDLKAEGPTAPPISGKMSLTKEK